MFVQPIPRPKLHKHRAKNNPKPTADDICMFCSRPYAQTHECFGGKNRQLSIRYGLQVKLCDTCHREITDEKRAGRVLKIKQIGQRKFEEQYGHEEYMRVIGRDYIAGFTERHERDQTQFK